MFQFFWLTYRVYDGFESDMYQVNISVQDINLRPPVFTQLTYISNDVVEHAPVTTPQFLLQVNAGFLCLYYLCISSLKKKNCFTHKCNRIGVSQFSCPLFLYIS